MSIGLGLGLGIGTAITIVQCTKSERAPGGTIPFTGGCLERYITISGGCALKLPEEGHSLGPWVQIEFEGSGSVITVSNQSSPTTDPKHVAVIKSFEFGYSDGFTVRAVIHDQQGGSFVKFMENLMKDWICLKRGSPANVRMRFQFGWSKSGCPDPIPAAKSICYYALCDSVETNFSEGKIAFEISGKDIVSRMFEGGSQKVYGGNGDQAIHLLDAVEQFMKQGPPPNVANIKFCRVESNGKIVCAPNVDMFVANTAWEKKKGKKGKYIAAGEDKLSAVRRWLRDNPAISPAGSGGNGSAQNRITQWIPQYNSQVPGGEIIFWADKRPPCEDQNDSYWDENCIGTYIVNGSKSSPVIEFNPKIRWDFSRLSGTGGNMGDMRANAMNTEGSQNLGRPCLGRNEAPGAGHTNQTPGSETSREHSGPNQTSDRRDAQNEELRTLKILADPIEADLTIVGDPTICPPSEALWVKNVAIVVVNPFHIMQNHGSGACGEWISRPACNEILSNKAWLVKSICHRIEAGNYTTTIGVMLTTPGVDTPPTTKLGAWTGGWKPPTCS
jgi:hypothetical protein